MRKPGCRFGLLVESAHELIVGGVLLAQNLYRDPAAQQDVGTAEDRRHAALAEFAVEPVPVIENTLFDQLLVPVAIERGAEHFARDGRRVRRAVPDVLDDDADCDAW